MATVEEILAELGITPDPSKAAVVKKWNTTLSASEGDAQTKLATAQKKMEDAQALQRVIDENIRTAGLTETNVAQLRANNAALTAANASLVAAVEEIKKQGFTGLNIPLEHPSRDAFDTFYLKNYPGLLLRSHTSPVQVRAMKAHKPPLAIVVPGRVYRPDAVDASHLFMFHQIEGFLVDENIRFSDLKGTLSLFAKSVFGSDIKMRFRPHFFPFTEPSAEVDISCIICQGKGCSVCGQKGWLEILGSGMIHPRVFKNVGYKSGRYTGFAFGMGVERIAMLKYGIDDIRLFFENDLRLLKQL